jgi:clathrin heavy chain
MAAAPVVFEELFTLPSVGISPTHISFSNVTMESDRVICVRETSDQGNKLAIIDVTKPDQIVRRPITADSAIMNPESRIIALRAGAQIQLFDITSKTRIKSYLLSEGDIVFWKWLSGRTLGIVTANAVYSWSIDASSTAPPAKVFDRHPALAACQVINLVAGVGERWLALVGIRADDTAPGGVLGKIQLYAVDRGVSQILDGYAAGFCDRYRIDSQDVTGTHLFAFASKTKFHVVEVAQDRKPDGAPRFEKRITNIVYAPGMDNDFPVALQVSSKLSVAYLLTKYGYIHAFDLESGKLIYANRISESPVFVSTSHRETGGLIGINRRGQVLVFAIDPPLVVEYILRETNDLDLAIKFAARNALPGADDLFAQQFRLLFDSGKYREAAQVVAESPAGNLRTPQTMEMFKAATPQPNVPSPLLLYLQVLLEHGNLNNVESIELGRQVVAYSRLSLLERWIKENRIECSEELGDLVRAANDHRLALAIYLKAGAHRKVFDGLIQLGEYKRAAEYAKRNGIPVDALSLIQSALATSPKVALEVAESLATDTADHAAVADLFLQRGMVQEATSYLLDVMREDRPEQGDLQTKVLEINLTLGAPQVADAILAQEMYTHFDKQRIAVLCERAGLAQRALQLYTRLSDVKRILVTLSHAIQPEYFLSIFANLSPDDSLELLDELLTNDLRGNIQRVVQVAIRYSDALGPSRLIDLFEKHQCYEGMYLYLGAILATSKSPYVVAKYIEAACRTQQWSEAERVTRESDLYNPEQVKELLFELRPKDPRPIINVCEKGGDVEDMVRYFVKQNQLEIVKGYVQRINPGNTPAVVAALLDSDSSSVDDVYIKSLLMSIKSLVPIEAVTQVLEERQKLKLMLQLLEALVAEGSKDRAVHTALAKVYVDANINPEHFLETNEFYDARIVGNFCERRDPLLAFIAYAHGACDDDVLRVTSDHGLWREQARYVIERMNPELWARVLEESNPNRKTLLTQVIGSALMENRNPEQVSAAVKALMRAGLQNELLELLEKLVLQAGGTFANNTSLQNLLLLTSIRSAPERTGDYIRRLDAFDGATIGQLCLEHGLYDEAFATFAKFEMHVEAVSVLIDQKKDIVMANEYAAQHDRADIWARLGDGLLRLGELTKAVQVYMRAGVTNRYRPLIQACRKTGAFADLATYLQFVRSRQLGIDEELIDSELVYALACCDPPKLSQLEELLASPQSADLDAVGDRLFSEGKYEAARLLFVAANNYARLAECLVYMREFTAALEAARKANKLRTWKTVCYACVEAQEFRIAELCALHLIVVPEELDEVIRVYETRGYFDQIMSVLENGLGLDKAHNGMFTELAVLYSKYAEQKVMEHLLVYWSRCNLAKVIRALESAHLWNELCFAHMRYEEYDAAAMIMMEHAPLAWSHKGLEECLAAVTGAEVLYRAVSFYMDEHPDLLIELLGVLQSRLDPGRVLSMARQHGLDKFGPLGHVPLLKPYMLRVQDKNLAEVNEALNEVLIMEEDVDALVLSVERYPNFDQMALAQRLEKHELPLMRQVAVLLLRRSQKYERALELCKRDMAFREAAEIAAESGSASLAESIARYFLESNLKEAFTMALYLCYPLLRPDLVLEWTWRFGASDYAMPFYIQTLHDYGKRLEALERAERDHRTTNRKERTNAASGSESLLRSLTASTPMLMAGTPPTGPTPPSSLYFGASGPVPSMRMPSPAASAPAAAGMAGNSARGRNPYFGT